MAPTRKTRVRRLVVYTLVVIVGTGLLIQAYSLERALITAAVLIALDRLLLLFESRGWIRYRRIGPHWAAATYYTLQLSAAFDPAFEDVVEVKYFDEAKEDRDDSGGPPADDGPPPSP